MFIHNINPVLLQIGPLQIRYYGLFFVLSFIMAFFLINYLAKRKEIGLKKDDVPDLLFYLVIGVIIGARLFYVFLYNWGFYSSNLFSIIALWQGGLSFHGGLIGALAAGYIFTVKKGINFLELADIVVVPLALGLFLGRIGNFVNGELFGRITNVPWAVKFPGAEGFRHPSQLYESLKNLFIFAVLFKIRDKKLPKGFMFFTFLTLYGLLRFVIEFYREPDPQLGFIIFNLTMGQLLSLPLFVVGLAALIKLKYNGLSTD